MLIDGAHYFFSFGRRSGGSSTPSSNETFLDIDNQLGVLQPRLESRIVALELGYLPVTLVAGTRLRAPLLGARPASSPRSRIPRHEARCDEYKPSRRSSAETSPGFLHASASCSTLRLYSALNRRRVALDDTSFSVAANVPMLPNPLLALYIKLRGGWCLGDVGREGDAMLSDAARKEPAYLDFLDELLREEVQSKRQKRVAMGIQIAHFPVAKTLDEFDFRFQPSVDAKLVRELATGRFIAQTENVLLFGPPGVGKTHLAIALGRAAVETGHSTLFVTATALLAALMRAHTEGKLAEQLSFYAKPKLLVIDELGYLPFESKAPISSFNSSPVGTSEARC